MIDDHRTLPEMPRKTLVLKVRRELNRFGIKPGGGGNACTRNQIWRDAWRWAFACRSRFNIVGRGKKRRFGPDKWPEPTEIATQYLFLLLAEMRNWRALRLPFAVRHEGLIPSALAAHYLPDLKVKPAAMDMRLTFEESTT